MILRFGFPANYFLPGRDYFKHLAKRFQMNRKKFQFLPGETLRQLAGNGRQKIKVATMIH